MTSRAIAAIRDSAGLAACALSAALMGCVPSVRPEPPPPPHPSALFPAAPLAELPPPIPPVDDVACSFRANGTVHVTEAAGGGREPLRLRFDAEGPPFAEVISYDS